MAVSITGKFLNQDKREYEALTVTLPSVLNPGGGRLNTPPEYVQYGETYVASVTPAKAIGGKTYLLVEEAFPTGATATITVDGQAVFTDVAVDATGLTTSSVEDFLMQTGGDVNVTIGHATETGDVVTGELKVVTNYVPYTVKNGRYSDVPAV
jgi:hypothetical protein